ncbi:MAG: glycosyltransferase family 39 protein [Anaerolineales bacterium]|nr:glycosyltransferase family 39 protein [Anaerolineales bacterium]
MTAAPVFQKTPSLPVRPSRRGRAARGLGLSAVVALAAALRFANLSALGYANHYYTAGVVSMLQAWRNFYFVAAEPGGAVSIDKPPVGLWLQAISAHYLGISGFAMVLPEIICGLLAVVVVYQLVRRRYGTGPGLLAALALALTPIVVATDRNNTIDSSLILVLLLAAWAFSKATETARLRWLLLGAGLVGVGFNIKMLQAYLPLPAFFALYWLGADLKRPRKLLHLGLATALLLAVSLAWVISVDLTPASQRPFVGSSPDNSELSLALGYNGLERLTGMGGSLVGLGQRLFGGGRLGSAPQLALGPFLGPDGRGPGQIVSPPGAGRGPGAPSQAGPLGPPPLAGGPPQAANVNGRLARGGGAFPGTGRPGLGRLFMAPLNKEASWLLPFALGALALLGVRGARRPWRSGLGEPLSGRHQTAVVWGGWLLTGAAFFSVAGFFHEYYLSMLAAPTAVLMAVGVAELWQLRAVRPWAALGLLLAAAAVTLWFQTGTATEYIGWTPWLAAPVAVGLAGAALLALATAAARLRVLALAGTVSVAASLLVTPGVWSGLTTAYAAANQSLPAAYSGAATNPPNGGGLQVNAELLAFLQANTQGQKYLLAVPSSMQGADYVIATGRPVLYLGGFMGRDRVIEGAGLARLVAKGDLRYIYWQTAAAGGGGRGMNNPTQSSVSAWVVANCTPVRGFEAATRNSGAPDGTGQAQGGRPGGAGGLRVSLFDCGAR